jgi:hypothetical protein
MPDLKLWTVPDAADELGVVYNTLVSRLRSLAEAGESIGVHTVGGMLILTADDIKRLKKWRAKPAGRPKKIRE